MRWMLIAVAWAALLATSACGQAERNPAPVAHAAHAAPVAAATPPAAQRWPADAALHTGMTRIRVVAEALAHAEHGHLDAGQVATLADQLQSAVDTMFAECKLEPAADAALHPLLARVLAASAALREKPADPAPVTELREVLLSYPQLFDDPQWSAATTVPAPAP